mmetsp:Transcript_2632/g.6909  ORF Transcript_2632/g.6909 Transcript_2632/m.6909 type:complete len:302 (-) Transcript_2632:353-1258(-)|eukprot:jgi/Tetstr1/446436/TSEL_033978.t1
MWIDDGSGGTAGEGDTVTCVGEAKGSSKFNAMWKEEGGGATAGEHFWQLKVLAGDGLWVGLSSEAKFGSGWRCKGAMYGGPGNTSDGGGLITGAFGEPVKAGDELGLLLSIDPSGATAVSFFHNGRPLGEAFRFEQASAVPLFPVVGFGRASERASITRADPPAARERATAEYTGREGHFELQSCTLGGRTVQPAGATMEVKPAPPGYQLLINAGNLLRGRAAPASSGGGWQGGPMMSTMMMTPPESMEVAGALTTIVEQLSDFRETDTLGVALVSAEGEAEFRRVREPMPAVCTRNIFAE